MRIQTFSWIIVLAGFTGQGSVAQTRVDIGTQSKNVDFSQAVATRPAKTGTVLPAACAVGEQFFRTNAVAGGNIYVCTAVNTWTQIGVLANSGVTAGTYGGTTQVPQISIDATGRVLSAANIAINVPGGGGASFSFQIQDMTVQRTGSTTLTIGGACSAATPCVYRFGTRTYIVTAPVTASISAATGVASAYIYLHPSGGVGVGHSTAITLNCVNCTAQSGVTAFPPDAIPLAVWSASATVGQWDTTGSDRRAAWSGKEIRASLGLVRTDDSTTGSSTWEVDRALVGFRVDIPTSALVACNASDWAADNSYLYICVQANTWRRVAHGSW